MIDFLNTKRNLSARPLVYVLLATIVIYSMACDPGDPPIDPMENPMDTTQIQDEVEIIVDGNEFMATRYNSIEYTGAISSFNHDLFVAESLEGEKIELYNGIFNPAENAVFNFQHCNYIDKTGRAYSSGYIYDWGPNANFTSDDDRFIGSYAGDLFDKNGQVVQIDYMNINVPFLSHYSRSEMSFTLGEEALSINPTWISTYHDTLRFKGGYASLGNNDFQFTMIVPRNIKTGQHDLEHLDIGLLYYDMYNQGTLMTNQGILSMDRVDFIERKVEGSLQTIVLIDGLEEEFLFEFKLDNF